MACCCCTRHSLKLIVLCLSLISNVEIALGERCPARHVVQNQHGIDKPCRESGEHVHTKTACHANGCGGPQSCSGCQASNSASHLKDHPSAKKTDTCDDLSRNSRRIGRRHMPGRLKLKTQEPIEIAMHVLTPASLPCRSRSHPIKAPNSAASITRHEKSNSVFQSIPAHSVLKSVRLTRLLGFHPDVGSNMDRLEEECNSWQGHCRSAL